MTIQGIIMAFVALIMLGALLPAVYSVIQNLNANATAYGDTTTPILANLLPVFLVLGVVLIPVIYTLAGRQQNQNQ
jgi:uncharacterized membrane protein YjgN (DUF898 family)